MPAPPAPTTLATDRNLAGQAFLVLFPAAVGCLLAGVLLDPRAAAGRFAIAYTTVALVLAFIGVLVPVLRIKKPLRAYRMLQGVGRSPLSRQAAAVALFLAFAVVLWVLALAGVAPMWLGVLTVVIGFIAVAAAGLTYVLGSQPRWRHWSGMVGLASTVLALGVSVGLVVALGWRDALLGRSGGQIAAVVLILVGTIVLLSVTWTWKSRMVLLSALLIALVAAALSLLTPWLAIVTLIELLAALFVWRSAFFLAVSVNGWRREVRWLRPETEGRRA